MHIRLACRIFWKVLSDRSFASAARTLTAAPASAPETQQPTRSEAVTLLSLLQREARLIDFLQEPIDGFSDAQVGAAVRGIHRDCADILARLFAITPLDKREEGDRIEVPAGFDPGCYRMTGNVAGEPPYAGVLRHAGWEITLCAIPAWSGTECAAQVIAPAEVELT